MARSGTDSGPVVHLGRSLAVVCAAQLVLQLDFSIVNVALPTIQRHFGMAPTELQWLVTGYALTFGSLLLLGGRLGDLVGHRRLLIIGLVAFAVFSLSAGLAVDGISLIVSRFLQGASAAMVAPQALATLTDLYGDGPGRTRALGIFQGATAAGASAGIVLGGILTQYAGWRWIFLVNPPLIVVLVIALLRVVPADKPGTSRLDVAGALLATASIGLLIYGLSRGQQKGFTDPLAIVAFALAVGAGVAFVIVERRVAAPMVPARIVHDPKRRLALGVMVLLGAVVAGYVYFTSLYLQNVFHYSALRTGLALIPATAMVMVTSVFLTRRLLARTGARTLLAVGVVFVGLGQVWLHSLSPHGSYAANVLGGLILTAFGMGLVFPTAAVLITAGVEPADRGLAGGLFATAQQVGQAIGLAALATVAAAAHSLATGYRSTYLITAVIMAVAFLFVMVVAGKSATGPDQAAMPNRPSP